MGNHRIMEVYFSVVNSPPRHEIFLITSAVVSKLARIFQIAWLLLSQVSEDTMVKLHNHLT